MTEANIDGLLGIIESSGVGDDGVVEIMVGIFRPLLKDATRYRLLRMNVAEVGGQEMTADDCDKLVDSWTLAPQGTTLQ